MSGQHNLSIEITGQLNVGRTNSNINTQIKALEKSTQLKALNLSAKIDPKVLIDLQNQIRQMQSLLGTNRIKVFDDKEIAKFNQGTQKVFNSIKEAKREYEKFGQVKITENFNPFTGKIKDFSLEIKKADGLVEKLKFDLIHISDGANLKNAFQLNNIKTTDTTSKALSQIRQQKEELRSLTRDMAQVGLLSKNQLGDLAKSINLSTTIKDIEKAKIKYNELIAAQKELLRVQNAKHNVSESEKKRTAELQRQIELYKQQAALNVQNLKSTYGSKVDSSALQSYLSNVNQLNTSIPNVKQKMQDLSMSFRQISANANEAAKQGTSFGAAFSNAMTKFPVWMAASTAFYGSFEIIQNAISHVNELNKSLTELSIVWMKTQSEVAGFGKELQKIGVDMSITTNELAKGAAELARQGLSQEEVFKRMRTITEYAKISNLSFDESVKIMTASINSMGVTAERASDVFSYLGDATATGADEIGQAMQRVGGTAGAIGIEFEKVSSWIAVVSSRTRESAYTIGNSIKSIIARVQSLKENGYDAEDGTQVNQVSKALAQVGIQLVDAQGNFRNFGTVMDELGAKWSTLSNRQQAYIATTVAGSYQQSRFLNLMEGYGESVELYNNALDSAGIAHEKFQLYQEGTAAKIDKLKASVEGLYQAFLDSSTINGVIIGLTKLSETVNTLTNESNELSTATSTLFDALSYLTNTKGITTIADFFQGLGEEDALEKRIQSQTDAITKSFSTNREEVTNLSEAYKELSKNKDSFNAEQEKEYLEVQTKLAKLVPTLVESYDEKGQVILKSSDALEQELKLAEQIYETEKQRRSENASSDYTNKLKEIEDQQKLVDELTQQIISARNNGDLELKLKLDFQLGDAQSKLSQLKSGLGSSVKDLQSIEREVQGIKLGDEYKKIVDDVISSIDFSGVSFEEQKKTFDEINKNILAIQAIQSSEADNTEKDTYLKVYEQNLSQYLATLKSTSPEIDKFIDALHQVNAATEKSINPIAELNSSQADLSKSFEETARKVEPLNALLQDIAEGKSLSASEAADLILKEQELANAFSVENSMVKVNAEAVKALRDAKIKSFQDIATARQQDLANQQALLVSMLNNYGIRIKAIQSVADAENALSGIGSRMKQANSISEAMELEKTQRQVEGVKTQFEQLETLKKLVSSPSFGTKPASGSKGSKSEYTPLTKDAKELLRIETELEKVQAKRQQLSPTSQGYRDGLQEEKQLLQDKISLLQKEYDQVNKTQRIGGKSNKIGGSSKDSDEALKRASELEQQILKLQTDLSSLSFEQITSATEEFGEKNQYLDSQLKRVEATISSLSSTSQEYRNGLEEEINILQLKQDNLHSEANLIRDQLASGRLTIAQQDQLKKKLQELGNEWLDLNNSIKSKNIEVANSKFEQQDQLVNQLNATLEQSKARMSGLAEGSNEYNASLSQQNSLLITMRSITEQQIASTLKEIQVTDQKSARYQDLISQLNGLRSAQIGYNNSIKANQALKWQKINEKWDKDVASEVEDARKIRDEIIQGLQKLTSRDDINFDPESLKTNVTSALTRLKNLNGEFVIDPKIKSLDSFDELEKRINEYVTDLEKVNKTTEDFFDQGGTKKDLAGIIGDEAKYAVKVKNTIKETNKLLQQKKLQYDQIKKSLENQIGLIEKQRDSVIASLQKSMEVPIEIDWEKVKDDLVDLGQTGQITIGDIVLDLDKATVIGDVPTDSGSITKDIIADYSSIVEMSREIEKQNEIFKKQEEIRKKIIDLESQNKEGTKEYTQLKKELEKLDKDALAAREKIQKSIEKEIVLLNGLREEERAIKEEIQERETVYKKQIAAIDKQLEAAKKLYDDQIAAQKEKLKLFDEENDKIDRQIERTKLLQELEKVRKDKRFEYINERGEVELTYDKGRAAELEEQLKDFDKETKRKDDRKQIEDNIERLEQARDDEIQRLEKHKEQLKTAHDAAINQLNFYLNQNKQLQDKLNGNINKHINDLQNTFNREIEYQNQRLERLTLLFEAEIEAMEAFVSGLETQLDRINADINDKISDLADRLDENIDRFAESAYDLGMLLRDIKAVAGEVPRVGKSSGSNRDSKKDKHHNGQFVGNKSPSKVATLTNKVFNGTSVGSERDITSLVGELQIPPKNLGIKLEDNLRKIIEVGRASTSQAISHETKYIFGDVTVKANNPMEFYKGMGNIINANKK